MALVLDDYLGERIFEHEHVCGEHCTEGWHGEVLTCYRRSPSGRGGFDAEYMLIVMAVEKAGFEPQVARHGEP